MATNKQYRDKPFITKAGTELPILLLRGQEYLEVVYRIVWFREEHPNYAIETELVLGTENSAVYKAYIKDDKGNLLSTGHKSESKNNFSYFREKAETGSIGRALNFLGYGTQFCADELDEGHRIVDEPIKPVKKNSEQDKKPKEDIKKYRTADLVKIRERLDQKVEAGSDLNEAEQRNYDIILAELIRRDEEANK